jgi:7-carboxy-7-deazaguanine synthase
MKPYPISETFVEIQGEGVWTGVVMQFIRLAGCTVGKPYPKEAYEREVAGYKYRGLPIYTEKCTLYDGREFPCDTDYRVKDRLTAQELVNGIPQNVKHVCITGGEPLMHDLSTLISHLWGKFKHVHIETSGTIVPDYPFKQDVWITVSPKKGYQDDMMMRANEVKLLVDDHFTVEKWMLDLARVKPVYLHPVNGEHTVNAENLQLCRNWQNQYPDFRLGVQLHKAMSTILKEEVR